MGIDGKDKIILYLSLAFICACIFIIFEKLESYPDITIDLDSGDAISICDASSMDNNGSFDCYIVYVHDDPDESIKINIR